MKRKELTGDGQVKDLYEIPDSMLKDLPTEELRDKLKKEHRGRISKCLEI